MFVGHKSHFQNGDWDGAPVDSGHIVRIGNAPVVKSGCLAVGVQNTLGKLIGLFIELGAHKGWQRREKW